MTRQTGDRPRARHKVGMFDEVLAADFAKQRKAELEVARQGAKLSDDLARRQPRPWVFRAARAAVPEARCRGRIRAWLADTIAALSLAGFSYGLLFLPLVFP